MPTYEYQCQSCGHIFEQFQRINDDPFSKYPECEGTVKRLISGGTGFIMKGESAFTGREPRKKPAAAGQSALDKPPCSDDSCCTK
ncbi:MAG TPA: zinc ribbon domain-containing protein [Spirochaetota bacterium]|nr:zinc ribbon domain-containing protein [Spirochaetota bacterium]